MEICYFWKCCCKLGIKTNTGIQVYPGASATSTKITCLQLGNNTATGTAGNKRGILRLYNDTAYYG